MSNQLNPFLPQTLAHNAFENLPSKRLNSINLTCNFEKIVGLGISLMEFENEVSTQKHGYIFRTNFEIIIDTKIGKIFGQPPKEYHQPVFRDF